MFVLAAALSFTSFISGCSDEPESNTADPGAVAAEAPKEVTVPISPVAITVVDAGDDPTEVLGPRRTPGVQQAVTLMTTTMVRQRINDQADQDLSGPALTIPLTATTDDKGVDITLGKVTTPDAQLAIDLHPAEGSQLGLTLAAGGAVTALRISPAGEAADSARSAIEQAFYQAVYTSVTFPETAIGIGAIWTMRQHVSGGVSLDQVTTATLTERDGDLLTVALDVRQVPSTATWNLPNGAGMLKIDDYVMHGTGTVIIDLGMPLPVGGSITVGGEQTYSDPTTKSRLRQTTANSVKWGG